MGKLAGCEFPSPAIFRKSPRVELRAWAGFAVAGRRLQSDFELLKVRVFNLQDFFRGFIAGRFHAQRVLTHGELDRPQEIGRADKDAVKGDARFRRKRDEQQSCHRIRGIACLWIIAFLPGVFRRVSSQPPVVR